MKKDEIVHYFSISECDNRVRLCISNINLDARFSKFVVSVQKLVGDSAWGPVEGTQRGAFWTYEEAEKMAFCMYKAIAKNGTSCDDDSVRLSVQ
jgi:hypothetical protein